MHHSRRERAVLCLWWRAVPMSAMVGFNASLCLVVGVRRRRREEEKRAELFFFSLPSTHGKMPMCSQ
jgi:hypothetical protein